MSRIIALVQTNTGVLLTEAMIIQDNAQEVWKPSSSCGAGGDGPLT